MCHHNQNYPTTLWHIQSSLVKNKIASAKSPLQCVPIARLILNCICLSQKSTPRLVDYPIQLVKSIGSIRF